MTTLRTQVSRRKRSMSERADAYSTWDLTTAAAEVARGLPTTAVDNVQRRLGLSNSEMARIVHISPRTLTRRRNEARLLPDESERVYRIGRLTEIAIRVLGSDAAAQAWFRESNFALGDETPLELARTEPGAELVERVLNHIENGIPV